MKSSKSIIVIVISAIVILLVVGGAFVSQKISHRREIREAEELLARELPPVTEVVDTTSVEAGIKDEVNLPVPFTVQAPHGDWGMPYQEACEEAAALMAIRYSFGNPILGAWDADAAIKDLVRDTDMLLNSGVDQTAEDVMDLIIEIEYLMPVKLIQDPSVKDLKIQLSMGNVVIVPTAGRKLGNPFYSGDGPRYHMLVLRGYTADGYFITNDSGTKRGDGYLYPFDVVMNAMGDWNDGKPESGEKVVVVVGRMGD